MRRGREEEEGLSVMLTESVVTLLGILLALAIFLGVWLFRAERRLPEERERTHPAEWPVTQAAISLDGRATLLRPAAVP